MLRSGMVGRNSPFSSTTRKAEKKATMVARIEPPGRSISANRTQMDSMSDCKYTEAADRPRAKDNIRVSEIKEPWNHDLFVSYYHKAAREGYGDAFDQGISPEKLKAIYEAGGALSLDEFAVGFFMFEQRT